MSFFQRLEQRVQQVESLLCVGLDPHLPELAAPTAEAGRNFCLRLIEATAEVAAAYKPNMAFFEVFGAAGIAALGEVIAAASAVAPVILDAKRGDIASTAQAYAQAAFQTLGAQAITINPYLGQDSLEPFLADPERGVFLLCKTSNPGAGDLQDLLLAGGYRLYEQVARLAVRWNERDNLGLVVGATHPEALRRVRQLAPELWILAPGVGAQGGELSAALAAGLRQDGSGLLLPVSRALSRAAEPRRVAQELRQQMNALRQARKPDSAAQKGSAAQKVPAAQKSPTGATLPAHLAALADGLLEAGCVKMGRFTLKSGLESPIYLDLRLLASEPALLAQAAAAYGEVLRGLTFDRLAALPYAALPIATAISLQSGWPLVYPRKEAKAYGTRAEVEGRFQPGERCVVIDDLATTGGSKFEAIEKLLAADLQVQDVVVLVDRQSGAAEALAAQGYRLWAVFTLEQLIAHWQRGGKITPEQADAVRRFLAENSG